MNTVYIETSIVSHATAWPSRDITIAGLQQQALDWWANERRKFELVTSQLTLDEAADGDPSAAADAVVVNGINRTAAIASGNSIRRDVFMPVSFQ